MNMILAQMNLYTSIGNLMYGALAAIALWGAFCVVMVWYRVREKRFRTEDEQTEFLEALDEPLLQGDFEAASEMLEGDKRATSQLALLAIINRDLGYSRVRQLLVDRFQRDVLADLEHRIGEPAVVAPRPRSQRRVALVRPGGVRAGTAEEADFLLRAGAAVLVDGYNVAKLAWPELDLAGQRERLVAHAEDVAARFGSDITVVFDGADVPGAATTARRGVRVMYSPAGVIADDVIRAETDRVPASRAVVVVTEDRAIVRDVRAAGANVIPSRVFAAAV